MLCLPLRFASFVWLFCCLSFAVAALAQSAQPTGAPVVVNGQTLFELREGAGQFTAIERAAIVSQRIEHLANNPFRQQSEIIVVDASAGSEISAAGQTLLIVTDTEAQLGGRTRTQLAHDWAQRIRATITAARAQQNWQRTAQGTGYALLATFGFLLALLAVNWGYARVTERILRGRSRLVRWARMEKLPLLHHSRMRALLLVALRVGRIATWVVLAALYLSLVFSFFPATRNLEMRLLAYALTPLAELWERVLDYLPKLFFLLIIAFLTWALVKLAKLVLWEIGRGTLRIQGFEAEWAHFTYKIVAFLLIVGGLIVAFPYLPGSESPAFRGISIFLGVLFSLASSSAVSNVIAGILLTYTGAFRIGDRVRIADVLGDVTERTLLVTRLRSIKNEEVSIPNAVILNGQVINYSAMSDEYGLILHTTVTIGYNTPWRQVHELLIAAARATPGLCHEPAPFVLQTSLNDYHISYELNATTQQPLEMVNIYARLHEQIQEHFNTAGVEIMSPAYSALRDGNTITLPEPHRPAAYQSPAFQVAVQAPPVG